MKNLCLAVCLILVSITAIAQNDPTVIEVRGYAPFTRKIEKFRVEILLTSDSYYNSEKLDKNQLKASFFTKAEALGLDKDRFEEDYKANAFYGYSHMGVLLMFETGNEEDYFKVLGMHNDGPGQRIGIMTKKVAFEPMADQKAIAGKALENARKRANTIATAMGRSLGDVVSITEYQGEEKEYSDLYTYYTMEEKEWYSLLVKYRVK